MFPSFPNTHAFDQSQTIKKGYLKLVTYKRFSMCERSHEVVDCVTKNDQLIMNARIKNIDRLSYLYRPNCTCIIEHYTNVIRLYCVLWYQFKCHYCYVGLSNGDFYLVHKNWSIDKTPVKNKNCWYNTCKVKGSTYISIDIQYIYHIYNIDINIYQVSI